MTIPSWLNQPDYLGAMRSGAALGLQRRGEQDRTALATENLLQERESGINRLQLAYDQLAAEQEVRSAAIQERREETAVRLGEQLRAANALNQYRNAALGETTRHHRASEAGMGELLNQELPGFMEDLEETGDFVSAAAKHPKALRLPGIMQLYSQEQIGQRAEKRAEETLTRFRLGQMNSEIERLEKNKLNPVLALSGETPATVQKTIDELKDQRQQLLETLVNKTPAALDTAAPPSLSPADGTILRYDNKGNRIK